jgi:hypothetical protein
MTNWETNNNFRPMYRQTEIETDEGTSEVMVPVGRYDTDKGIKSYNSAIEYDDTNNDELFYEDEDGNYIAVD